MDGTGSELCAIANRLGVSGAEPSGSTTTQLIKKLFGTGMLIS